MMKAEKNKLGHVLQTADTALLLIDTINDFDFPGSERLLRYALPAAQNIARLKKRCSANGVPTIYVNDNFGVWRSDFKSVYKHCASQQSFGRDVSTLLRPEDTDYFVLKPKHSGFYSTTLQVLLTVLECKKLILTGFAGNICVLFTANDAYMRDYELAVPSDCTASNTKTENHNALKQIKNVLKAEVAESQDIATHFSSRMERPRG